ncbi:ABC transporter substrate-binding protein [Haloferax mediterranei ATCC 33500]|uniref:ABC transporter substrate-binding protein n=1 Tax=Haloferax mediterranei (strain ATCC 33500 / DSM 1411 / JCM 8866 / NBRC 14739 / NCIMB 2177 / R-4) TaxID=523841 RepID=I3R5P9_HALMT|nr:ABC transporter substrate-binding protein [Haloferax mediterranei]AFK19559.1 ABC-type dipeptide/oligopeptide/nickel transport system, substrate-binding protein [Haloferax mediterranei ATCC 33500]AHZ22950.1 ABC transporter substrate-binding protein [Haloferax mediterranei ATCC 33500]ELZ99878.1 ABC-type dipeptide/oligopeptide/nickel transport system, substrate-binding protein [Haloferax mediterranei ATCC 33500]MDX5987699.1 ABC transporter substrate-binding protein [Haloferax mediterranei ATCC 
MASSNHDERTDASEQEFSRRRYLVGAASVVGAATLAGCSGTGDGSGDDSTPGTSVEEQEPQVPEGTPEVVETQYWHDWETIDAANPPLDYSAAAAAGLDPLPVEFSSEDDPWMREHALMVKRAANSLGLAVELNDRPLNQLYAQSWETPGLEAIVSMSTHGPDPQRGLDPNPLLMRRHKDSLSNYDNYFHPKLNDLLDRQRKVTGDNEKRQELVSQAQQLFAEDVGGLITLFPDVITAVNTNKWSGYVKTPGNGPTGDSFRWTEVNLQPETDQTTYVKGVTTSMNSLNLPWAAGGAEEKRLTFVYDGLFDATPDLEVVPALATDAKFTDDTTVEMSLREGVTWHDGEPFTAEDVKFTVELYKEQSSTSQVPFYEPVESVEVLGEHSVRFNLSTPDAAFMTQRVVRSVILPKHKWENVDNPSQHNPQTPVGTGPFKVEKWEQGTRFEVSRNDDHWLFDDDVRGEYLGDQTATGPGIERIIWINVGNVDSLIGALQQGKVDAIGTTLSNTQANRASSTSGIEKSVTENFAPLDTKLNFSCPLIRDKEFRVAFAKAVDEESFVESVLEGRATVPNGENPISPITQWHEPDTKKYENDVEGAKAILRKAGYTWDSNDNIRFPNGEAWAAFVERVQNGNTHKRRSELGQPDFS